MLITVYGDDFQTKKHKLNSILNYLKKQRPDAIFSHLDFLDLSENKLDNLINTQGGLFEEKNIILLSNIFYDKNLKKIFFKKIKDIENSKNAFVLSEDFVEKKELEKIKKHSQAFHSFIKKENSNQFNIFSLSDNLQTKNKKQLWLQYHQAQESGLAPEQIFSNFFFSLKSLSLAKKFSLKESGLKPFPYQKAKNNLKFWKEKEVDNKIFELISGYNHSRLDDLNLKNFLEKFILEL